MGVDRLKGFLYSKYGDRYRGDRIVITQENTLHALVPEDYAEEEDENKIEVENSTKIYWCDDEDKQFPPRAYLPDQEHVNEENDLILVQQATQILSKVRDEDAVDKIDTLIIDGNNLKYFLYDFNCDEVKSGENISHKLWTSHFSSWSHFELQEVCEAFARVLQRLNIKVYFIEDSMGFIDGRKSKGRDRAPNNLWEKVGKLRKILDPHTYPGHNTKDFVENASSVGDILRAALRTTFQDNADGENLVCFKGLIEADATLARIAYIEKLRGRNAYIVSNDSDLALYPHVKGVISSIKDFSEAHPAIRGNPPAIRFKCIYPEALSQDLFGLSPLEPNVNQPIQPNHIIPAIWGALNGNDYIWQTILAPFHDVCREEKFKWEVQKHEKNNGDLPIPFWISTNYNTTTLTIRGLQNWMETLRLLYIHEETFMNIINTLRYITVGGWVIKETDQGKRINKIFEISVNDIDDLPLDIEHKTALLEGYSRYGINKILIFEICNIQPNNLKYEIQFSVRNIKSATLIEDTLQENSLVNSEEPFASVQVLNSRERNSLFKCLADKIKINFLCVNGSGQQAKNFDPLHYCIAIIYDCYRGGANDAPAQWHDLYKKHIETWLGIRSLRVTRELIGEKLSRNPNDERITELINELNNDYNTEYTCTEEIIFRIYRIPFVEMDVDRHQRFKNSVHDWLFENVETFVTFKKIEKRLHQAIDPYTLMQGFDWEIKIFNRDNTNYVIPKTNVLDISLLSSRQKAKSSLIDTFDFLRPISDAKYTIQFFNLEILQVTGEATGIKKKRNSGKHSYTLYQTKEPILVYTRADQSYFDYRIIRIADPLTSNELNHEIIPFLPEDTLMEKMRLDTVQTENSREAWETRLLSALDILNDELNARTEQYIAITEYIRNHDNLPEHHKENTKLLFLTLRYWIDKTRLHSEGTETHSPFSWFLKKKWLKAILAVIFKRLLQDTPIILNNNMHEGEPMHTPDYEVMKFMIIWMDLTSSISGLVATIDDYRKLINNQHNPDRTNVELQLDNIYMERNNTEMLVPDENRNSYGRRGNQNENNINFQPLFQPSIKSLNVFAVDWKSMANALAILDEHEDNLNTFLDKCGLDNNAREMFDIFFQRLHQLEDQVIAF